MNELQSVALERRARPRRNCPLETFATKFGALEDALRESGVGVERPLLTLQTLTFPGVPALKLTALGYANVLGRSIVGLEPANPSK